MSTHNNLPAPIDLGLRALVPSIVRTLIPVIVALAVRVGFSKTGIDEVWVERALTLVVTMGYYIAVRVLERNWSKIGWLLGYPTAPVYVKGEVIRAETVPTPPTTTTVIETDEEPPVADDPLPLDDFNGRGGDEL